MGYGIGSVLAFIVAVFARLVGLDRDRAFYPTVLIVIASTYVLFAVMGGSMQALMIESIAMTAFIIAAVIGFKFNPWIVVLGLVGHGIFDFFHGGIINNPGVPVWWPSFCLAYDVIAGGYLAWLLSRASASLTQSLE